MTRRFPAPTVRGRMTRAAALPMAALLLAGCQWTSTVQTDKPYEPADGRSVSLGGVHINNLLVVAKKKGESGVLVGRAANETNQPVQLSFQVGRMAPVNLDVKPMDSAQLTDLAKGGDTATVPQVPADPGGLVDVVVSAAGGGSSSLRIPVVAPNAPYASYVPSSTTSPEASPTPSGDASSSPSESPTSTESSTGSPETTEGEGTPSPTTTGN